MYAKNTIRLQERLDVYWIVHNFVRTHFTTHKVPAVALGILGIHVKRDSEVSVRYAEELNSSQSSVLLQRADRHEILGQKPPGFQLSL
jgi:hypothetical protein